MTDASSRPTAATPTAATPGAASSDAGPHPADSSPLVVDARGLHCPQPVIELAKAVDEAAAGALVEIWSDDPSSRVDIPVWVRLKRHDLIGTRELDPGVQAYVVRTSG